MNVIQNERNQQQLTEKITGFAKVAQLYSLYPNTSLQVFCNSRWFFN